MKTIILTLMLLLVGCSRNEVIPESIAEQLDVIVSTDREGVIYHERRRRGAQLPRTASPPQSEMSEFPEELQSEPTKDEQVQIPKRKIKGYRAKTDPATGKISTYPVYEDEKK